MTELLAQKILIVTANYFIIMMRVFRKCILLVRFWCAWLRRNIERGYNLNPMWKKRLNKKIEYYQIVNRNTISNDNAIFFIQLQHVTVINMRFVRSVVFDSSTSHTDNIKCIYCMCMWLKVNKYIFNSIFISWFYSQS